MSDKILEYIQKHVVEWPEGITEVYLCADGEIAFVGVDHIDFYPDNKFEGVFIPDIGCTHVGKSYTREEWEGVTDLTKLDKPFGELDRATQLKLVEHVLDGGCVERCDPQVITGFWWYQPGALSFVDRLKYRAI